MIPMIDPSNRLGSPAQRRSIGPWARRRRSLLVGAGIALLLAWGLVTWAQGSGEGKSETTEELETFVPTEEVGAEQAVAFPVDI